MRENFNSAKVLMADDNPMNILMAKTFLQKWNCQVRAFESGEQVIEDLKTNSYDIILLDLNMPEMRGEDVAKFIRTSLEINTPIIGYTADAIDHQNELFLETGMNDFITLPFKHDELNSILNKWIPLKEQEKSNQQLYDLSKLEAMGDSNFLDKMLNIFLTETAKEITNLEKALDENRFGEVAAIAHKIKPSISYVCITRLFDNIVEINNWEKEDTQMIALTNEFISEIKIVFKQLNELG